MIDRERVVADIAQEVVARLLAYAGTAPGAEARPPSGAAAGRLPARAARTARPAGATPAAKRAAIGDGVFATVDQAVGAARVAQVRVAEMSLEQRGRMIAVIRRLCDEHADDLGRMELAETRIGRLDHKIAKLKAMRYVLGVEVMRSDARSDQSGLCLIERAPWGVIGMVLPATHSVPTMVSNAINVLAAGNTAVFSPHPAGALVAAHALAMFNREIERETGVTNVITTMAEPSIQSAEEVFRHPDVALLCVTGGPAVVKAAAQSGKRVIAGGPGNPPVVVDDTADLDLAARSIITGAVFDNNLLCNGEKEVFVLEAVADAFVAAMKRAGAFQLDARAITTLTAAAFTFDGPGTGCGRAHV
ncbi:MAG: aldehyde dehydrogenase family protein, partial [Vicinamibacterales bacterium]|nr:aldehyde dehydrogenase family protein [Vicinamibacterales bacterium]